MQKCTHTVICVAENDTTPIKASGVPAVNSTLLKDCIRNTTAVCGNVATVGYNYICANSDRLHVLGELWTNQSSSSLSGIYIPQ